MLDELAFPFVQYLYLSSRVGFSLQFLVIVTLGAPQASNSSSENIY